MLETVRRWMNNLSSGLDRRTLRGVIEPIADRMSSQPLNTSGLLISSTTTLAKTGAADCYLVADGVLVKITAGTDMPALTGLTITANSFNVVCFFTDKLGTRQAVFGTEGTTIALVKWPQFPSKQAFIGALLITHSSTFTGGTTALNTATTVYLPGIAAFDPTIVLGA